MAATYCRDKTEHQQAAARCGLRLKFGERTSCTVQLVDDKTGGPRWQGAYWDSWDFLRDHCGLQHGAH